MGKYSYQGLTSAQVSQSKTEHGSNELPPPQVETFWEKLKENFEDPLIKILCVALVITVGLAFAGYADWFEGVGIAAAVFLATFVATYSEFKNESSFQELQQQASRVKANVFRNGVVESLNVGELVVGDYILLQAGDKVPVDGSIVEGSIGVSQASLNGEPDVIKKTASEEGASYNPSDRDFLDTHLAFRGAIVEDGEAVMTTHRVGTKTEYGKLFEDIEKAEERDSPLTVKLENLANGIAKLGYIGAVFIFVSFLFKQFVMDQGYDISRTIEYMKHWQLALHDTVTALILSIIIIVVAVPEGLPMMIAIVLALNMSKLLEEKVLVRRLLGIETAGSLNTLFTDKTGTITRGHLETHHFLSGDQKNYMFVDKDTIPKPLEQILHLSIKYSTASHIDLAGNIIGGNLSDRAFLAILDKDLLRKNEDIKREKEILFNSTIKFSATNLIIGPDYKPDNSSQLSPSNHLALVKGAPEKLLPNCGKYYTASGSLEVLTDHKTLEHQIDNLSHAGIRVIAITTSFEHIDPLTKELPATLNLVGFLGLRDEIRKESKSAILACKNAGIQVVMITGDRKETAISIAREVGLLPATITPEDEGSDKHLPRNSVLTSEDLQKLSNEELAAIMPEITVIARALPTDKSRLVEICQSLNKVVGMTGDGVNDAAALNRADVGFAMGSGTDMAKEAADIVIMDDNFDSIAKAILYGRTIFRSIRKFIIFQSTINTASTLIVFLGPFLGFDFPLTLIQLLWVNLVMDTLAALAFGGEPALQIYMTEKPIRRDEAIVSPYMWSSIIINGVFIATLSVFFLVNDSVVNLFQRDGKPSQSVFLTAFFGFFIFITTLNAFNVRTKSINILEDITKNRGFLLVLLIIFGVQILFTYIGGSVLRTVPLQIEEWILIIFASLVIIPWDIIRKALIAPWLPKRLIDNSGNEEKDKKEE